jgi:hypothetical protein
MPLSSLYYLDVNGCWCIYGADTLEGFVDQLFWKQGLV